jgi:hypothetical protein
VDILSGGTGGDTFVAASLATGSFLTGTGSGNTLQIVASPIIADLTGATISGIQTLTIASHVTLMAAEFAGFSAINALSAVIATGSSGGTIFAADAGTYDLKSKATTSATGTSMTALSNGGTTLIGNDTAAQFLRASFLGNDTLQAGNGAGDFLVTGGGNDTLISGTGSDTFQLTAFDNHGHVYYSTLAGDTVTFDGSAERIVLPDPVTGNATTLVIKNGTQETVNAHDGIMTVTNGVGGVTRNVTNWNAGGSFMQTYTQLTGGGIQEQDTGYAGGNGTGAVTYQQTLTPGSGSGQQALALSGSGNSTSLSNAVITLADNASATVTGSGNTVSAGGHDTLSLAGGAANAVTVSGAATTVTDDGASFGNSFTLGGSGDGLTLSGSGDTVTVTGTGSTVNITGTGDLLGQGSVSFNGAVEEIAFANTTVFVASGVTATITAPDGVMTVTNGVGGVTKNVTDFTAGGSQVALYSGLPSGAANDFEEYAGADGTGTHLLGTINWSAGGSQVHYYTGLGSGIASEYRNFSGSFGGGTLLSDVLNFTSGGSQVTLYAGIPTGAEAEFEEFAGPDGTGQHLIDFINWSAGGSQVNYYTGLSQDVDSEYRQYADSFGGGALLVDVVNFTSGGSQITLFTGLPAGASQKVMEFSAHDGFGNHLIDFTNWSAGGSRVEYFTGLQSGASSFYREYSDSFGGGSLLSQTTNFTAGGSERILFTGLPTGASSEILEYAGADGTGTLLWTSIMGSSGNDTLTATGTSQALVGNGGSDTYKFGRGDGADVIQNGISSNTTATGELDLGTGITTNDLWFQHVGNDLVVELLGTQDRMTVAGWYANAGAPLEEIKTAGGSMIDSQLNQLVQAMATFGANNSAFNPTTATAFPTDSTLQGVLAASWHS